ncbi:hypothetical protein BGZ94_004792 [Podila epigama]|nr:hypothetical protein BGZ94_004792 [Podila epigama]
MINSSASSSSSNSLAHSREFGSSPSLGNRALDYFSSIPSGPGLGLGLGPMRYMDREDWRGRPGQFPREFEREREMRGRDMREPRPPPRDPRDVARDSPRDSPRDAPRDPRDHRDLRDPRDSRDFRDVREPRDPRDLRDFRDIRDRTMFGRDHDRDVRESGLSTRDYRERDARDARDRGPRDRGSQWNQNSSNRESRNSRDGPELDVRELVEMERERERDRVKERDRERERFRERPIWIRESDRDYDSLPLGRSSTTDSITRDRDRHSIVQELDRDLLAYTSDKVHVATSSKSDDSVSVSERSEKSKEAETFSRAFNETTPPYRSRAAGQDIQKSYGSSSVQRSKSQERPMSTREEWLHESERDVFDRDRNSNPHSRTGDLSFRSDYGHRIGNQNVAGFGKRQRVLSAPISDDHGYADSIGSRHREHTARGGLPSSPETIANGHQDRSERTQSQDHSRDHSDLTESNDTGDVEESRPSDVPRPPSSQDISEPKLEPKVDSDKKELEDHPLEIKNEDIALLPQTESLPQDELDVTKSPQQSSNKPTVHTAKDVETHEESKNSDIGPESPSMPSTIPEDLAVGTTTIQTNRVTPSTVPNNNDAILDIVLKDDSKTQDVIVAQDPPRSSEDKDCSSPSTTSLPSPRLSPVEETHVVSIPVAEFENHANILTEIDIIDSDIQKYEELLRVHRVEKEKRRLAKVASNHVELATKAKDNFERSDVSTPVDISSGPLVQEMEMDMDVVEEPELVAEHATEVSASQPKVEESNSELAPEEEQHKSKIDSVESSDVEMEVAKSEVVELETDLELKEDVPAFSVQDIMKPIDVNDPFHKRRAQQTRRPQLFDQIYAENSTRARKYGRIHLATLSSMYDQQDEQDESQQHHQQRHLEEKPRIYASVQDYPFYQENIDRHARLRSAMLKNLAKKAMALDEKELNLKREYKQHWELWTKKIGKLDKQREKMANASSNRDSDQVVSESSVFTTRNRRGAYTSDAVRSEAELLEIIQSLENADMRDPDVRASRTAATVPPMILDSYIRENVHYYDYNHLVTDPANYYHLGPVTDVWTEEEREIFIKRYLNYPKQFGKIAAGIEGKTASQCVLFYYREKKKIGFKDILSNRGRKRKNPASKRKEKVAPPPSPGKKHKGSALIEDIGQANRTKQAKTKELRELQESNQVLKGFEVEPGSRRRVRSGAAAVKSGTPGMDDTSPGPSSTASTPVLTAAERRKQRSKTTTRGSKSVATVENTAQDEKKSKVQKSSTSAANKSAKQDEPLISVDSPGSTPAPSKGVAEASAAQATATMAIATATATTAPAGSVASARWTTAEHAKAIEALKKYGRDFEAVAAAVGTKTVDQCRNFCFNYKRKFGVSALDDANNLRLSAPNEDSDIKDTTTTPIEKSKARRGKTGSVSSSGATAETSSTASSAGKDSRGSPPTVSSRKRTGKLVLQAVPELTKDEPMQDVPEMEVTEEQDVSTPKSRRKRTVSKSEAGTVDSAPPSTSATSFRALYSRDPPTASNSPALSGFPSTDSSQFPGQNNVESIVRKPNFSSYWSRQEKIDFVRLLVQHGKDWAKIAKELKTKTPVQVRNHFSNNADKLVADGVIGIDVVEIASKDQSEPGQESEPYQSQSQSQSRSLSLGGSDEVIAEAGPRPGYFMPPPSNSTHDSSGASSGVRETRSMSPPRRATNIGNLLNNSDEDVHVAAEDWFANSEENSSQGGAAEEDGFKDGQTTVVVMDTEAPSDSFDPRHVDSKRIDMEDDAETEDEDTAERMSQNQKVAIQGVREHPPDVLGQRRMSEGAAMSHRGYLSDTNDGQDFYGQRHPHLVQKQQQHSQGPQHHPHSHPHPQSHPHPHPQGTSTGVLGSPYGASPYYNTSHGGFNAPHMSSSSLPGSHSYQRMHSPPVALTNTPSATIAQPRSHPTQQPHHHQRSSSIGHPELTSRPHPSPQMSSARQGSPVPYRDQGHGPYFSQHHYGPPPVSSPLTGPYVQHRHSQSGQLEIPPPHPPRSVAESQLALQHSSIPPSSGHLTAMSHPGPARYSSSPQLPPTSISGGGVLKGSPGPGPGPGLGPGNGSPAHLGHGSSSRYSPAPVVSPMASEGSLHYQQQGPYHHHHRRSSSPFQHHVPGHVPAPTYLHAPPPPHSSYSSSHGASSLLPPPLPVSSGPPVPSEMSPGSGYHDHGLGHSQMSSRQYSPSYGHPSYQTSSQQHHAYVEHSGGASMPPSSSPAPSHPQRPVYRPHTSSNRHPNGSSI